MNLHGSLPPNHPTSIRQCPVSCLSRCKASPTHETQSTVLFTTAAVGAAAVGATCSPILAGQMSPVSLAEVVAQQQINEVWRSRRQLQITSLKLQRSGRALAAFQLCQVLCSTCFVSFVIECAVGLQRKELIVQYASRTHQMP